MYILESTLKVSISNSINRLNFEDVLWPNPRVQYSKMLGNFSVRLKNTILDNFYSGKMTCAFTYLCHKQKKIWSFLSLTLSISIAVCAPQRDFLKPLQQFMFIIPRTTVIFWANAFLRTNLDCKFWFRATTTTSTMPSPFGKWLFEEFFFEKTSTRWKLTLLKISKLCSSMYFF